MTSTAMEKLLADLNAQNQRLAQRLAEKTNRELPDMTKLAAKLAKQNEALLARVAALEQEPSSPEESPSPEAASPLPPKATTSPALTPKATTSPALTPKAKTPLRRSPRRKRKTPDSVSSDSEADGTPVDRRLSAGLRATKKKRTPKPQIEQALRKTLGEILYLNMDEKITSGYYLDDNRFFSVEKFEDDTRALVDFVHQSAEIDTTGFSKLSIFKLAVKVAKKRESNYKKLKPKKKKAKNSKSKKKNPKPYGRYADTKIKARAVYQALVASKNAKSAVSPAVASASAANAAASAAAAAAALASASAAPAAHEVTDKQVDQLFEDSESSDDVMTLEKYNRDCQAQREQAKAELAKKKAVAAAIANEKAVKKAELAKQKAAQKAELAKKKADQRAERAKKKAEQNAERAKKKAVKIAKNKEDCLFKIGMAVCGFWPDDDGEGGEWYEGIVQSIDYVRRTVHVLYKDGDIDDAVPWHLARILDDIVEPG